MAWARAAALRASLGAVDAPEPGQFFLLETLYPDGDAVDAGPLEAGELVRLHRARVGLHGDPQSAVRCDACAHPVQQRLHSLHAQKTRGTTAYKDGGEGRPWAQCRSCSRSSQQGPPRTRDGAAPLLGVGVEVAIGALLDAPGHVDIEERGRQLQHGVSSIQKSKGSGCPGCR